MGTTKLDEQGVRMYCKNPQYDEECDQKASYEDQSPQCSYIHPSLMKKNLGRHELRWQAQMNLDNSQTRQSSGLEGLKKLKSSFMNAPPMPGFHPNPRNPGYQGKPGYHPNPSSYTRPPRPQMKKQDANTAPTE